MPTTDELYELKAELKRSIRTLEKRGAMRSWTENDTLKRERAALRRVTKELAKRNVQLRLF